jgi:hypothetical protein
MRNNNPTVTPPVRNSLFIKVAPGKASEGDTCPEPRGNISDGLWVSILLHKNVSYRDRDLLEANLYTEQISNHLGFR